MSIPQICPCCGEHRNDPHAPDCSFGTSEYAFLGWPKKMNTGGYMHHTLTLEELSGHSRPSNPDAVTLDASTLADIIKRCEVILAEDDGISLSSNPTLELLRKRSDELRAEAKGISLMDSRAKRNFAADVLDRIISELEEASDA